MDRIKGSETLTDTESDDELNAEVAAVAGWVLRQNNDEYDEHEAASGEQLLKIETDIEAQKKGVKAQIATILGQLLEEKFANLSIQFAELQAKENNVDRALLRSLDKSLAQEGAVVQAQESAQAGAAGGWLKQGSYITTSDDDFSEPESDSVSEDSSHDQGDASLMGRSFIDSKPSVLDTSECNFDLN